MTIEELKRAYKDGLPVLLYLPSYGNLEYECIDGFVEVTSREGVRSLGVRLKDYCGHSYTIADPRNITVKEARKDA